MPIDDFTKSKWDVHTAHYFDQCQHVLTKLLEAERPGRPHMDGQRDWAGVHPAALMEAMHEARALLGWPEVKYYGWN